MHGQKEHSNFIANKANYTAKTRMDSSGSAVVALIDAIKNQKKKIPPEHVVHWRKWYQPVCGQENAVALKDRYSDCV